VTGILALYAVAWGLSGFHGVAPPLVHDQTVAYAAAPPGQILVSPLLEADCTGDAQDRANCLSTLIHELAHEFQKPGMPVWQVEGGAEAFARLYDGAIERRVGVAPIHWAYNGFVRQVRMLGLGWLRKGQFVTGAR